MPMMRKTMMNILTNKVLMKDRTHQNL